MKYLLDTNAVIALLKGEKRFIEKLTLHRTSDVVMSSIVVYELYYGAFKSQKTQENISRIENLRLRILRLSMEDACCAGKIRSELERQGQTIGPYDLLIAGQALSRGLTLVTHNTKEFNRVEGLSVVDWI